MAITALNQFLLIKADQMLANLQPFVSSLYRLTSLEDNHVRKAICQSFVLLLETRHDILMSELQNVIEFMMYCTSQQDESIALEACEFWLTFAESAEIIDYLTPHLPKIVPVLVKSMVYSDEDAILLDTPDDDANVPYPLH
jgi:transportin-1